jgi:hypothetical protein
MSSYLRPAWQPVLPPDLAAAAIGVARDVSVRLRDPGQIDAAAAAAVEQTAFPRGIHWQPYSIAQGYAGLAITCGYLDQCFPSEAWDRVGRTYLTLAGHGAEASSHLPAGLWSGLSGLTFTAWYLSRQGTRYRKLLATLEEALLPQVFAIVGNVEHQRGGVSVGLFDLISGLSGIGAYLLCRIKEDERAGAALEAVVRALIGLSHADADLPRWYTPAHLLGDEKLIDAYPHGNLNCGLAHGVPGPLAMLSLAHSHGVRASGLPDAIERLADWLVDHRCDDAWGINWPNAVALELDASTLKTGSAAAAPYGPSRTAWCYGSPGIARALWLAGEALDCAAYRDLAVRSMEAVYRRPRAERQIDSPTFCHGVAGLMQITLRFAHDTGLPLFRDMACALGEQLLSLFEPTTRLGYYSLEPGGRRVDQPGLLDGAPGVPLVLLAAATTQEPHWDRVFLLG